MIRPFQTALFLLVTASIYEILPRFPAAQRDLALTLDNDGNTPLDLDFVGRDNENHLTVTFLPDRLEGLGAGSTTSVQVVASGRRKFSGPALQNRAT